jgi:hypothetical protein
MDTKSHEPTTEKAIDKLRDDPILIHVHELTVHQYEDDLVDVFTPAMPENGCGCGLSECLLVPVLEFTAELLGISNAMKSRGDIPYLWNVGDVMSRERTWLATCILR